MLNAECLQEKEVGGMMLEVKTRKKNKVGDMQEPSNWVEVEWL